MNELSDKFKEGMDIVGGKIGGLKKAYVAQKEPAVEELATYEEAPKEDIDIVVNAFKKIASEASENVKQFSLPAMLANSAYKIAIAPRTVGEALQSAKGYTEDHTPEEAAKSAGLMLDHANRDFVDTTLKVANELMIDPKKVVNRMAPETIKLIAGLVVGHGVDKVIKTMNLMPSTVSVRAKEVSPIKRALGEQYNAVTPEGAKLSVPEDLGGTRSNAMFDQSDFGYERGRVRDELEYGYNAGVGDQQFRKRAIETAIKTSKTMTDSELQLLKDQIDLEPGKEYRKNMYAELSKYRKKMLILQSASNDVLGILGDKSASAASKALPMLEDLMRDYRKSEVMAIRQTKKPVASTMTNAERLANPYGTLSKMEQKIDRISAERHKSTMENIEKTTIKQHVITTADKIIDLGKQADTVTDDWIRTLSSIADLKSISAIQKEKLRTILHDIEKLRMEGEAGLE